MVGLCAFIGSHVRSVPSMFGETLCQVKKTVLLIHHLLKTVNAFPLNGGCHHHYYIILFILAGDPRRSRSTPTEHCAACILVCPLTVAMGTNLDLENPQVLARKSSLLTGRVWTALCLPHMVSRDTFSFLGFLIANPDGGSN